MAKNKKFIDGLNSATDEVSQVQPLYREEVCSAVKSSKVVHIENDFGNTGTAKTIQDRHVIQFPKIATDKGGKRDYTVADIKVGTTDGIIDMEFLKLQADGGKNFMYIPFITLLECKLDDDFNNKALKAAVILQVICYFKMIEAGEIPEVPDCQVPLVAIIGSKKGCFLLKGSVIDKYINRDIFKYTAASQAYTRAENQQIVQDLMSDDEIAKIFVHSIDDTFDMGNIVQDMYDYLADTGFVRKVDEQSLAIAFNMFSTSVLKNASKLSAREQVKYFMTILLHPDDVYMHPKKADCLMVENTEVAIDKDAYLPFREQYGMEQVYTLDEQREITAIQDRLIEDADRRRKGDFYTPDIWVKEAHKLLDKHLGSHWRSEYIVYDCACGTKNLTRDYQFGKNNKNLYCSTIMQSDIDISARYNPGAVSFQYDFLNDDVDEFEKLADLKLQRIKAGKTLQISDFFGTKLYTQAGQMLIDLLAGKPLLFLINPPYGTAKNGGSTQGNSKAGIAISAINTAMKKAKIGASSQQLYAQFLYRICSFQRIFGNVTIGMFSPPAFMTGGTYKGLRQYLLQNSLGVKDCFIFCASEFADVKGNWGIGFTLLSAAATSLSCDAEILTLDNGTTIKSLGTKTLYNTDNDTTLSAWIQEKGTGVDAPQMTNAISIKPAGAGSWGSLVPGSLGYLHFNANNIEQSAMFVGLYTSCTACAHGYSVLKSNFEKACCGFTVRKLMITPYATWANCKDEFLAPDTTHSDYKQFESDSIVYSLFNTASNQSSLRDISYNNKSWDIENQFFWLSSQFMHDLAQGKIDPKIINNDTAQDIIDHPGDRFVYTKLQSVTLSPDAKAVLEKATELLIKSFPFRQQFNTAHPEYHVNTWDAGWYQVKAICKEYLPDELKEFQQLYNSFADRLRPMVYTLGFLKGGTPAQATPAQTGFNMSGF